MLTVVSNPREAGTTAFYPKLDAYPQYYTVTLTALPSAGYVFDHWSGEIQGIANPDQNPVTLVIGDLPDNRQDITANFIQSDIRYTVTANPQSSGSGSVSLDPVQPPDGYLINQGVSARAVPAAGYLFNRWSGAIDGTEENPTSFVVDGRKAITAVFNAIVTVDQVEGGTVETDPAQPSGGYSIGTEVTVVARADKGYKFDSWSGDLSGSWETVTMKVDGPKTITAVFVKKSSFPVWAWVLVAVGGLALAFVILRLVSYRLRRSAEVE